MKNNSTAQNAFTRFLTPAVVSLAAVALLAGYAGGRERTRQKENAVEVQLVQFDTRDSTRRTRQDANVGGGDQSTDPVENYKLALALLKKNYYGTTIDDKKTQQLTYDAIRGMLFSLRDQFTSFLDPNDWGQMQATTHGDFEGIGAMLAEEKPDIKVVEPIETGPAEKVGIKANDIITRVDDVSVIGQDLNDVVKKIKGPAGTQVKITVVRGKETKTFTITRARVEPPVVKFWMEDNKSKIGHVVLKEFNEKSMDQMNKAFESLQHQGMKALVFDLRYNPGGLLDVAVDVASVFIARNSVPELKNAAVIIHEGSGREQNRQLESVPTAYTHKLPLVVLVNDNSASASEIVSGAIKDYAAGTLIGERTYGKGRVQTLFPLEDGSALRLTTALYFPPRHHDINFKRDEDGNRIPNTGGILPNIEVKQSTKWKPEDFNDKTNDTQLHAALDFLNDRLNGMSVAEATQQVQTKIKAAEPKPVAQKQSATAPAKH